MILSPLTERYSGTYTLSCETRNKTSVTVSLHLKMSESQFFYVAVVNTQISGADKFVELMHVSLNIL